MITRRSLFAALAGLAAAPVAVGEWNDPQPMMLDGTEDIAETQFQMPPHTLWGWLDRQPGRHWCDGPWFRFDRACRMWVEIEFEGESDA